MATTSPTQWLELSLEIERDQAESVEMALRHLGAEAITLLDNANQDLLEPGVGETPLWTSMRVIGLFQNDSDRKHILNELKGILPSMPSHQFSILNDRDWERVWLDDFKPQSFGERLWICPSWQVVKEPDAVVVKLDPGLAFGTGTHPTTSMCLQWLDKTDVLGCTVVDFGCGSGILAIAALALGAKRVIAIDNDPQALQATRNNANNNNIPTEKLITYHPDALSKTNVDINADIVMANILAGPLLELAPTLLSMLRDNGRLVLSGILEEQAKALTHAYTETIDFAEPSHQQGWVRLDGIKSVLSL